jgi:hypothetical protein
MDVSYVVICSEELRWNYVCGFYVKIDLETNFDFGYFPLIMTPTFNGPVFVSRYGQEFFPFV